MDSNHRSLAGGGSPLLGLLTSRTRPRPAPEPQLWPTASTGPCRDGHTGGANGIRSLGFPAKMSLVAGRSSLVSISDGRRRSGDGSLGFVLFGEPLHRAGLPYGLGGLRLAALLGRFGLSPIKLKDPLAGEQLFEPVEKLGGGIDLVVILAIGEDGHLVEVFGEPG